MKARELLPEGERAWQCKTCWDVFPVQIMARDCEAKHEPLQDAD